MKGTRQQYITLKISSLTLFVAISTGQLFSLESWSRTCEPFRIYFQAEIPSPPFKSDERGTDFDNESHKFKTENELVSEIDRLLPHQNFADLYMKESPHRLDDNSSTKSILWLKCVYHYVRMDINGDGTADWTPVVDGRLSDSLLPNKADLNGDGIENLWDPHPLQPLILKPTRSLNQAPKASKASKSEHRSIRSRTLPKHLLSKLAPIEQSALFREFHLISVDHTDTHSPFVLRELLLILRKGLPSSGNITNTRIMPPKFMPFPNLRTIYAFKGHDDEFDIAAFHPQLKALSIGGIASYGLTRPDREKRIHILAALAHELGHAFLFAHISSVELKLIGKKYGHWPFDERASSNLGPLTDPAFLEPHPLLALMGLGERNESESQNFIKLTLWNKTNLTSEYAATNLHEWFADAFAASVLLQLGESGYLGNNWRPLLTHLPNNPGAYWVNYNNLSQSFRSWIKNKIAQAKSSASNT
jgi:hypothetical protein